ncbi:MAG: hypothetical protein ACK5JS_00360 [Mangrovibacterium sp.]
MLLHGYFLGYAAREYKIDFKIGEQNAICATLTVDQIGLEQVVVRAGYISDH